MTDINRKHFLSIQYCKGILSMPIKKSLLEFMHHQSHNQYFLTIGKLYITGQRHISSLSISNLLHGEKHLHLLTLNHCPFGHDT